MRIEELESILLFVSDLDRCKRFYADLLGLPIIFEDRIVVVLKTGSGRVVLHRNDRGHDDRGIFPVGVGATGVAVRFSVDDPDAWEVEVDQKGFPVLWKAQDAAWGRFVLIGDPDGRPVGSGKNEPASLSRKTNRGGPKMLLHRSFVASDKGDYSSSA